MVRLIKNIDYTKKYMSVTETGVYKINSQNKFINWVIKFLLKKNIIKQYTTKTESYTSNYMSISMEKVGELLQHFVDYMYDYTGSHPIAFMMGAAQFNELKHEVMQLSLSIYRCELQLFRKEHDKIGRRWRDIEIIINPFIDGIVPLNRDMMYQ